MVPLCQNVFINETSNMKHRGQILTINKVKTPSQMGMIRMCTIRNGHNPEWTQSRMDTILIGHDPDWARSQMDTIPNGHNPEWTQSINSC